MDALTNLGIDLWSVVLHLVNIFSLVIILTVVLYKPIFNILDKRQKIISSSLHEAENLKHEFEKQITQMKKEQETMRADFEEQMRLGKKGLDAKRAELIEEMDEKKRHMLEETMRDIDERKARLIDESKKAMVDAMGQIIHTVIQHTQSKDMLEKSIEKEWDAFVKPH